MSSPKDIFKNYQAQTFPFPSCLEVASANGSYIFDVNGKEYLDFVAGVSACTLGHSHPIITNSITKQLNKYSHVMVYGEYVLSPQYRLAKLLVDNLPSELNSVYFTNSGTESIEGAIKLAKRDTGRSQIISFIGSYHGSTQGSLSIIGNERQKSMYRPLIPDCAQITFNDLNSLKNITNKTAAVVIELIQGGSGFVMPKSTFLKDVRHKCNEVGALLIVDEIQTCFGRLGSIFGFEMYDFIPDIICIAKGMGAGMPIGAFISSYKRMNLLTHNPNLGHITTFGGHPLSCAASLSCLELLLTSDILNNIKRKELLFRKYLNHPKIKEIRGKGLMLAIELDNEEIAKELVEKSLAKGLILFYFLFTKTSIRITPPLTISENEIKNGCEIIIDILN